MSMLLNYNDYLRSLPSHRKDLLFETLNFIFEENVRDVLPVLNQKIRDLRTSVEEKRKLKKSTQDDLFAIDFLLSDLDKKDNKDERLLLLEDCLNKQKDSLKRKIEILNIDKLIQKMNVLESQHKEIEILIQKLNFFIGSN